MSQETEMPKMTHPPIHEVERLRAEYANCSNPVRRQFIENILGSWGFDTVRSPAEVAELRARLERLQHRADDDAAPADRNVVDLDA